MTVNGLERIMGEFPAAFYLVKPLCLRIRKLRRADDAWDTCWSTIQSITLAIEYPRGTSCLRKQMEIISRSQDTHASLLQIPRFP